MIGPDTLNFSEVWNIARRLITPDLRQLTITDIVHHPTEETLFLDVKRTEEVGCEASRCKVHWRVSDISLGSFQLVDVLNSPHDWQRRWNARFQKSMTAARRYSRWAPHQGSVYTTNLRSIHDVAEKSRKKAMAALQKEMKNIAPRNDNNDDGNASVRPLLPGPPGPIHTSTRKRMATMCRRFLENTR